MWLRGLFLLLLLILPAPGPALGQTTPVLCRAGYVWREAVRGDYVCVPPSSRAQAQADNAAANDRWDRHGYLGRYTCKAGFVWREIRQTDKVCVTLRTRDTVQQEAGLAFERSVASLSRPPLHRSGGGGPTWTHDPSSDRWCVRMSAPCNDDRMHPQFNDVELICECAR